jgi:hypothetical protein
MSSTSQPHRVLAVNLPPLLVEIVSRAVGEQHDLEFVGAANAARDGLEAAARQADLLIIGSDASEPLPLLYFDLLRQQPDLKLILVTLSQGDAAGYWLALRAQRFGQVAADSLVECMQQLLEQDPSRY